MNTNNLWMGTGRLSSDIKESDSGKMISFSIAISESKDKATFLNCKMFKKERFEFIKKYFKKGSLAQVLGSIQIEKKEGAEKKDDKYFTNIIVDEVGFLPYNKKDENQEHQEQKQESVMQEPIPNIKNAHKKPPVEPIDIKESEFDFNVELPNFEENKDNEDTPF